MKNIDIIIALSNMLGFKKPSVFLAFLENAIIQEESNNFEDFMDNTRFNEYDRNIIERLVSELAFK